MRGRAFPGRLPPRLAAILWLGLPGVITVYPFVWLLLNSLKKTDQLFNASWALPTVWRWANYPKAWAFGLGHFMLNSVFVTAVSVVAIVLLSALAAYTLSVFRFPGRTLFHVLIVGGLIVPPEVSLFPLFRVMQVLGIYNSYLAMILPDTAYGLPFTVLLLRAYMVLIPSEMAEAAAVDGAGMLRCFWSVYLPLCRPALAAAALVQAMRVWNEFVFALTFVSSKAIQPLTVGLTTFGDSLNTDWPVLMAGLVISVVPVLLVFLSMQRQFMAGLTAGALK